MNNWLSAIISILGFTLILNAQKQNQVFMFSYFTGNGGDDLPLAYSQDEYNWKKLNKGKSLLTSKVGKDKF